MRSRLRRASTTVSDTASASRAHVRTSSSSRSLASSSSCSAAWPVSTRNTSSRVGRRTARSAMPTPASSSSPNHLGDHAAAAREGHPHHRVVHLGRVAARGRERLHRPGGLRGILEGHLQPLAADPGLELVRGTLGDHLAVVDHGDAVRQPVGLVERLGGEQHGGARRHAGARSSRAACRGCGVEPGGGLVQEEDGRVGHQRGAEVEAAAHAAGVGAHQPAGGLVQLEAVEQLLRPLAGPGPARGGRAGRPSRGSRSR